MEQSPKSTSVSSRTTEILSLLSYLQENKDWENLPAYAMLEKLERVSSCFRSESYQDEEKLIKAYAALRDKQGPPNLLQISVRLGWTSKKTGYILQKVRNEGRLI